MKNKVLILMMAFCTCLIIGCNNQQSGASVSVSSDAREAISALKELDTRLDIGVSYIAYQKLLGDTWVQVKPYYEAISENDVDLYVEVAAAMDDYREALGVWDFIFKESLLDDSLGNNGSTKLLLTGGSGSTSKGQYFMAYLPSIVQNGPSVAAMQATHHDEDANGKFTYIDLKEMQQLLWKDAKERLAKIDKLTK